MSWPTTTYNGAEWYLFDGLTLMPVGPSTGAAILMLRPQGGMGVGIPAIAQGDPGKHAQIDETINFVPLAHDDPTPADMYWTTITPPTDSTPGVYRLNAALHEGQPGDDGTTAISLASIAGTAATGKLIKVNSGVTGFDYTYEKAGDRYIPATDGVYDVASGHSASTVAIVAVSARPWDWRPEVTGHCIIAGTGTNVQVDLLARLNNETAGSVVGHCQGIGPGTGLKERLALTDGPPAGSGDTYDKVPANTAATLYLRTEYQGGSDNYSVSKTTVRFKVRVCPVP